MFRENDCGYYIKHINDALQRDSNNALRSQDLTLAQVAVLLHLESAPGEELTLKEVEKRLQVAQSTAAGIVVRLEHKQFVEAFTSQEDRRIKMVRITPLGLECCKSAQQNMREAEEKLLSPLTEEERVVFGGLLRKVSAGFRENL